MAKREFCYRCGGKIGPRDREDSHVNYEDCISRLRVEAVEKEHAIARKLREALDAHRWDLIELLAKQLIAGSTDDCVL